jgi:alkylation response protein AidB-like acyl-CoA dehydrogenase
MDETRRMGHLTLEGVRVGPDDVLVAGKGAAAAIERMIDEGALAVTAEASGAVEEALRITIRYANQRIQFGQPIGHFQAVKHPIAEMYTDLESFKSLLYYGAWALESAPEEVSRFASLAKAYATDVFVRAGVDCVVLHGAIAFTVDYDIQLYFKRSKWMRPAFGDAPSHYERALALRGV